MTHGAGQGVRRWRLRSRSWNARRGQELDDLRELRGLTVKAFCDRIAVGMRSFRCWKAGWALNPALHGDIIESLGGRNDAIWDDSRSHGLAVALGARDPDELPVNQAMIQLLREAWASHRRALAWCGVLAAVLGLVAVRGCSL